MAAPSATPGLAMNPTPDQATAPPGTGPRTGTDTRKETGQKAAPAISNPSFPPGMAMAGPAPGIAPPPAPIAPAGPAAMAANPPPFAPADQRRPDPPDLRSRPSQPVALPTLQPVADLPLPPPPRAEVGPTQTTPPAPAPTPLPDLVARQILPNLGTPGAVSVILAPAELGTLQFEVSPRGDALHLHLIVEEPATLDLLRRQGDQILAELRQAGFANASLSFAASDGQTGGGSRHGPQGEPPPPPASQGPTHDLATHDPAPRDSASRALGPGTLDLRL